ncbi:UNVERIFIED_CONTAM: hypothetical protein HDU68_010195 [Siphonaria sp. JEL0065]|nr:hypothetical protein HDU68_010195 [Siphonaria sp. JEL0065]
MDGISTGSTMKKAIEIAKSRNAAKIIVAAPIGNPKTCNEISALVDQLFVPVQPRKTSDIGLWYDNFPVVEESEVTQLLAKSKGFGKK